MDNHSQLLIELIRRAILQDKSEFIFEPADWEKFYQKARIHEVHTVIYPVVAALPPQLGPGNLLKTRWHTETLLSSMHQLQNIKRISEVLRVLHQEGVPVIALKGLVLMNDYPYPELRTMGDVDLLVQPKDLRYAEEILKALGYLEGVRGSKHITYECPNQLPIELHWSLIDERDWKQAKEFNDIVWEYARLQSSHEAPAYHLSPEDMVLHLLLHMGTHLKHSGFGLRQLCDLVLYVKAHYVSIDWRHLHKTCCNYGILPFTLALFQVCNQLFQLPIPEIFIVHTQQYYTKLEAFIEDILEGGVYGKQLPEREISASLLYYVDNKTSKASRGRSRRILSFLLPSSEKLRAQYRYLNRCPALLPLAWSQRLVRNCSRRDMAASRKSYLFHRKSMNKYEERSRLLQWLELR